MEQKKPLPLIPQKHRVGLLSFVIVVICVGTLVYFTASQEHEQKRRIKIAKQSFINGSELICRSIQSYKIISKSKGWKLAQGYTIYTDNNEVFNLNECKKYEE